MSGVAVNIGDSLTTVVPVWDNKPLKSQCKYLEVGGRDITEQLLTLLNERGHSLASAAGRTMVYDMKEHHCLVAQDYDAELDNEKPENEVTYELFPGAGEYKFNLERFRATEGLFKPYILGKSDPEGVDELVVKAIQSSGAAKTKELFNNIVVGGGTTALPGFATRLEKELKERAPSATIRLIARPNLKYSVWVGGSVLGSMDIFPLAWISKKDYDEKGASLVHENLE